MAGIGEIGRLIGRLGAAGRHSHRDEPAARGEIGFRRGIGAGSPHGDEDRIGALAENVAHRRDRIAGRGEHAVGRAEVPRRGELSLVHVDGDDPARARDPRPLHGVEPHAARADHHRVLTGPEPGVVQKEAPRRTR